MAQALSFLDCITQDLLRVGTQFNFAFSIISIGSNTLNHLVHTSRLETQFAQNASCHATIFFQQAQQ
jgi:hypothetical protein